jgi:hypothetical protein
MVFGFGQSEEEKAKEKAEKRSEIVKILADLLSEKKDNRLANIKYGIESNKSLNIGNGDKKYISELCQGTNHTNTVGNTIDRWNKLNNNSMETYSSGLTKLGGYVATGGRVILNGGGQKRVVYKRGGKGEEYVKVGGEFVNLKRNYTKKH